MMEFCVLNLATLIKALNAQMEKAATTATANTGKRRYPNEKKIVGIGGCSCFDGSAMCLQRKSDG